MKVSAVLSVIFGITIISANLSAQIDFGTWQRPDKHDGYLLGNGRMYSVAGLGRELSLSGKSELTDKPVTLTHIAWVIGPHYTLGNLGYGWDIKVAVDGQAIPWQTERIQSPTADMPLWGVVSSHPAITSQLADLILPDEPVMLRRVIITRPEGLPQAHVTIDIPVYPDPRNAVYGMFDGQAVDDDTAKKWRSVCGEFLRPRESVARDQLQTISDNNIIVHLGAARALWQEISTRVPDDDTYRELFPPRALATTVICQQASISTKAGGFHVDLGVIKPGEQRTLAIWIVTEAGPQEAVQSMAVGKIARWQSKDINAVITENVQRLPSPLITADGPDQSGILKIINSSADLVKAAQSHAGGIMAQPYMYPMYYIRDQYSSFKLLLSLGEIERAYRILQFYVGMQNLDGIQNAHDARIEPPSVTYWDPKANSYNGYHARAEVPSYIILMARDYLMCTNDVDKLRDMYPRLAYNCRVQHFSKNHLLPWAHDESYTNSRDTQPRFSDEMTDSNLLFLGAAEFMVRLANKLGKTEDAKEFQSLHDNTYTALMKRLWLKDKQYFAYARNADDCPEHIDFRPALDTLLRWNNIELGSIDDPISQGCLKAVSSNLVDPIRVVPEVLQFTAGMDPGYVLYALARHQHPSMHDAAKQLVNYGSAAGLFAEFYCHKDNTIIPLGGTLRPWESGVCGQALIQYLIGLQLDLEKRSLTIQPHLPPEWTGWHSRKINLQDEGSIQLELQKKGNRIKFSLSRFGGTSEIETIVEFGGFGQSLKAITPGLAPKQRNTSVLTTQFKMHPGPSPTCTEQIILVFENETQ